MDGGVVRMRRVWAGGWALAAAVAWSWPAPPAAAQAAVEILSVAPASIPEAYLAQGGELVLRGEGFGTQPGTVYVSDGSVTLVGAVGTGGAQGSSCSWSDTEVVLAAPCLAPAGSGASSGSTGLALPAGQAAAQVVTAAGAASNAVFFQVAARVALVAVTLSPSAAAVGQPVQVLVTAQGPSGPVPGATVALSAAPSAAAQLGAAEVVTGAGGTATTTLTGKAPVPVVVSATYVGPAGEQLTATATARFAGTCADAGQVGLAPAEATSGAVPQVEAGGPPLRLVATVTADGLPAEGLPVVLSASPETAVVAPVRGVTDARGEAAFAFQALAPGAYTLSAACAPGGPSGQLTVQVAPASRVRLAFVGLPARLAAGRSATVRVRAENAATGAPLLGLPVTFEAFGSAAFPGGVQEATAATGPGGIAETTLTDPACETTRVEALLGTSAASPAPSAPAAEPASGELAVVGCHPSRPAPRPAPRCVRQPFADVPQAAAYADAVCALHALGLLGGVRDGARLLFQPTQPASWGDLAAWIATVLRAYAPAAAGAPPPCAAPPGYWAAAYVADTAGLLAAALPPAGTPPPCEAPVAFAEAAAALAEADGLAGAPLPASAGALLDTAPGLARAPRALWGDLAEAVEHGLVPAAPVDPEAHLSRGALVALLWRAYSLLEAERAERPVVVGASVTPEGEGAVALTVRGWGFGWQPAGAATGLSVVVCPASGGGACTSLGGAGGPPVPVVRWGDGLLETGVLCGGQAAACSVAPGDVVTVAVVNPRSGLPSPPYRFVVP
jgi:hypothetical protein